MIQTSVASLRWLSPSARNDYRHHFGIVIGFVGIGRRRLAINDEHLTDYWMVHAFQVMPVIRAANGESHTTEAGDRLTAETAMPVTQIHSEGARRGLTSIRRWREKLPRRKSPSGKRSGNWRRRPKAK